MEFLWIVLVIGYLLPLVCCWIEAYFTKDIDYRNFHIGVGLLPMGNLYIFLIWTKEGTEIPFRLKLRRKD